MNVDSLLDKLEGVRRSGNGWMCRCPSHDDRQASLSIAEGEEGILCYCQSGCRTEDVLTALGLEMKDLFTKPDKEEPEAIYSYVDEEGTELYQSVRMPSKRFMQRHFDPFAPGTDGGGWVWNMQGVRRVLYRLPEVVKAVQGGTTIYIVEGEKDAEALVALGKTATCNPMGAGKWRPEYTEPLKGAKSVIIVADKDKPGRDHANDVRAFLKEFVGEVWIVEAKEGKDVSDHLAAGHRLEDLVPWNDNAPLSVIRHYSPMDLFTPTPPVNWVVENVVVGGETTLLIADGGAGKSFVALWMALCVASGQPFLSNPVSKGLAIYVDEEGSPDLALQRLAQLGATPEQRRNLHYLNYAGVDLVRHPRKLIEDALSLTPKLIVVDSHAKVTRVNEENSNNEMGRVWDEGFLPLARDTGAAVLVIHHTNGFGGSRGASQIRNSADQVLTMKKEQDGSQVIYASKPRRITSPIRFNFKHIGGDRYELQSRSESYTDPWAD